MGEITVTMPMKEYERLQKEIKDLKKENVLKFVDMECKDIVKQHYEITINVDDIIFHLRKIYTDEHLTIKISNTHSEAGADQ